MIYLLIIFLELLILFLLSKIIPTLLTASFRYFIRSHKVSVWIFSFLYLPGTFVHEMAHLLTAGILLVPVGGISLLPELKENGVKLGHVQIQKTDPIRRTLIGFAPVFLGLISLAGIIFYFNKEFLEKGEYSLVVISVVIYLVLVIGNTMFSSRKDMEGALSVMIVFASVLAAVYLLGFEEVFTYIKQNLIEANTGLLKNFAVFLGIPVVLDLLLYLFVKFAVKKLY